MAESLRCSASFDEWDRQEGTPGPMGVTWVEELRAWNFALYSRRATGVTLLLYGGSDFARPVFENALDARIHKSGRIWHCWIQQTQVPEAAYYAYRVEGRDDPATGFRFDGRKILLDPFAPAVFFPPGFNRVAAGLPGPNDGRAPLGVLPHSERQGRDVERPPRASYDLVVYELHVKAFTASVSSGVTPRNRGTFAGLAEKIPYLKQLGVTAVELMPVHQCDPQEGSFWGYMPLNFFSPHRGYSASTTSEGAAEEFRVMVEAFHENGIEVWLDVVYNHTSEADAKGPVYSYRGIDNQSYYILNRDRGSYRDDTGCGNTLRCDHPVVRSLILESLLFWISNMKVDGFRFDLASVFTLKSDGGRDLDSPSLIADISMLAARHGVRMVAEAWDIESYLLGQAFPGINWRQWNGKYRDDVRDFVRGVSGRVGALMQRLYGSDDLFPDDPVNSYRPFQSVNFITAHDGFCLYDLVSYNRKHNEANGHNNTDGNDDNRSWNCGWEGDEGAPAPVLALRRKQVRNFMALLMLSNGTPMICAGDEFLATRRGNNNPYNQDNEINYIDWDLLQVNGDTFRFVQGMIGFRKSHPSIARSHFWREDVSWYGGPEKNVDFSPGGQTLAFCLRGGSLKDDDIYVMVNAGAHEVQFRIHEGAPEHWGLVADTNLPSPNDFVEPGERRGLTSPEYKVGGRSVVVLCRCLMLLCVLFCFRGYGQTELRQRIAAIAADAKGKVSVACSLPGSTLNCDLNAHAHPPMQSVFKAPLALTTLHAIEQGKLKLDQPIRFRASDRFLPHWFSPLQDKYPNAEVDVPLRELLRLSVSESDNAATDLILRTIGGPAVVDSYIRSLGVTGFHIRDGEAAMHRDTALQYRNWFEPAGAVQFLRLAEHNQLLLGWMRGSPTPARLKGLLPADTVVMHKSGSSDTEHGLTNAWNDIGLITLRDGRLLAIAVFITDSTADNATRDRVIARIAKAIYDATSS